MLYTVHWQKRKRWTRLRIAQFLKLSKNTVFENFSNKNMWQDFYQKEVSGKTKAVHTDFLNTL